MLSLRYLGGGTFVLVLPQDESSPESVTTFLESTVFKDVFKIEGRSIRGSFKSGIARYPLDGEDASTLTQRAEAALKRAKESGEPYLHYQVEMHSELAERLALEHSLRGALDEQQFVLHYQPQINVERGQPGDARNHDTLGILALDAHGHLAGACTTSGMAFKLHGRVGDSPIIGAGLYVDNDVGAATASGVGEEMLRNAASFLVVEFMRQGHSPTQACRLAIARVVHKRPEASKHLQVCFLAMNKDGEVGAYALHKGFVYAVGDANRQDSLLDAKSVYTSEQK